MCAALELVRQRLEWGSLAAAEPVRECLREQPVGEPGIARQERPVEIGADDAPGAAALEAAFAVVAEAREHPSERLGTGVEVRTAGMVLEAGDRPPLSGLELALDQDVADHAALAGDGLQRKQADSGHVLAVEAAIAAAEQLVAAADRERGRSAVDRLVQRLSLPYEILRHEQLLSVLPAADVEEVVVARDDLIAHPQGRHLQLVPAPRRPPREHRDVPAIGIDVEVVRIEVADADGRHADRSQYG